MASKEVGDGTFCTTNEPQPPAAIDLAAPGRFYTPRRCSWLNQVGCWFSILARRALRRGSFASKEALRGKVLAFIRYFNDVLAKPFRWTYTGRLLAM